MTFLLILRKSTTLNLLGIECLYYSIRFLQFLLCLPSNKKRLHHFIPGRGPMDFCPGMARCPSNSEGRGRKSALSDKVFGRPVVHVRDSADRELRPVLHRLLGPPWPQSALELRPDGSRANTAAQAITFNKLSDYAILCSNYFYTNIYIRWLGDLSRAHLLPITFYLKLPCRI